MKIHIICGFACIPLIFSLSCSKPVTKSTVTVIQPVTNTEHISVLTQHNDHTRAGLNNQESILNTSNVNGTSFGLVFSLPVDDQVFAQPLVVSDVLMKGAKHNVVYIATVNNSIYAFDGAVGSMFWQKNFTPSGQRPPKNSDMGSCGGPYLDFSGNIGIVGTPVIDSINQVMYFVSRSTDGTQFNQYFHSISILDGSEKPNSPVLISATYAGTGVDNVNGVLHFNGLRQNQRQALSLIKGVVYISFSSHCDIGPYHGWVIGYDAQSLAQVIVYNDTPNGYDGGIWESGMGIASDDQGNLLLVTGNGSVGDSVSPGTMINRGESALKLSPQGTTLSVSSFFTPNNYVQLEQNDEDYGGMGAFLIPNSNIFVTGAKDGNIYLLNKDNMGGYNSGANQVQQTVNLVGDNFHCQPAYFNGVSGEFVYVWSENDNLRAFPFNRSSGQLDVARQMVGTSPGPTGQSGAVLSVSSLGNLAGTGIVWASYASAGDAEHGVKPGILRAFDATNITHELWNSAKNPLDNPGNYAKFSSPTIANGFVYLPTFSGQVAVYGLKTAAK